MKNIKNVLVDMSVTIIHHGHIRLLKKAKKYGRVIVALTSDSELKKIKKLKPLLNFNQRKEILKAIKYVDKVIESKWKISNQFLKKNKIDLIVRGHDHKDDEFDVKKKIFKRTRNISSSSIIKKLKN